MIQTEKPGAIGRQVLPERSSTKRLLFKTAASAQGEGRAIGFVADHSDLNTVRHAFEIVIELATGGLAGADAGDPLGLHDVARSLHEGVAAGMGGVADGNGTRVAVAVDVIGALACHAICDHRHFKGNLVHGMSSFQVVGRSPDSMECFRRSC